MAARRQVTNKLRDAYRSAAKHDKARILGEVMAMTGMGRSTVRRMLTGDVTRQGSALLPAHATQVRPGRPFRP